jgi:hypothetical protein
MLDHLQVDSRNFGSNNKHQTLPHSDLKVTRQQLQPPQQPNLPIRTPNNQPKPLQTRNPFLSFDQATSLHPVVGWATGRLSRGSLSLSNKNPKHRTSELKLSNSNDKEMMRCIQKLDSPPSWSCILLIRVVACIPPAATPLCCALLPK